VVVEDMSQKVKAEIEKRLKCAIPSPPRHLIVQAIIFSGKFEFDWRQYYPERWSTDRVLFFTRKRLPMNQPVINSAYKWVQLSISDNIVTIQQHQGARPEETQKSGKTQKEKPFGPTCF
jgi:hypothetical protein